MKNQQRLIVGIVLALVLIIFALLNGQDVAVNFFGAKLHWPLIVVIVVAVLIGALITLLVSSSSSAKSKKAAAELQKQNQQLTQNQAKAISQATAKKDAEIAALKKQLTEK